MSLAAIAQGKAVTEEVTKLNEIRDYISDLYSFGSKAKTDETKKIKKQQFSDTEKQNFLDAAFNGHSFDSLTDITSHLQQVKDIIKNREEEEDIRET